MWKNGLKVAGTIGLSLALIVGCSSNDPNQGADGAEGGLSGTITIDGSSTVYPLTQAVAEEFMKENPGVQVTVSESGTGGGFQKWALGETDINDASRLIKDEEKEEAAKNDIEPVELKVAFDGISVMVHPENDWVDEISVEDLKKIWEPDSKVKKWSDVNPDWPDKEIKLYAPGTSSGTFDYFTEAIVGEEGASRTDFTASEDDNVLVRGISGDKYSLGYFGYSYYVENKDKLKILAIDEGEGAVEPTEETINEGSYSPLSRPVFIYPSNKALEKEEVQAFIEFYLENVKDLAAEVGYVALPDEEYEEGKQAYEDAKN
ncbi:PstS family phosphate ABC transporter substrate-binding protein [Desmospora profundinema]|uniref:Phosphate-binding protein n=1 Tax=Desmospora profundinema TaxID=1571184 RepID=A0ABU1IPZ9_9BACL|nr:PstS family phosphate ABC transporter substrate-binding protein [Desmospora profundinema]MDR6226612.1 phosphate transport system substrate-binding protein [Desmospora profundinema]